MGRAELPVRPCCGAGRQRPIRHNTLDLPGLRLGTLCLLVCVVFNFPNDIIAIDPIRIRL